MSSPSTVPRAREGNGHASLGGVLRASDIRVHFEGVKAVDGVEMSLERGEILGLIGPNGAGKTTLLNVLAGVQVPDTGQVWVDNLDLTSWSAPKRARAGLARTFQGARLFDRVSVFENVEVGAINSGLSRREAEFLVAELLKAFDLADVSEQLAGSLPHGLARRLDITRGLSLRPAFLLLDEPAAGLNEKETASLVETLGEIRSHYQLGLLVIEHDVPLIMSLCDRVHVLDYGKTLAEGTPEEVRANKAVVEAYLGE